MLGNILLITIIVFGVWIMFGRKGETLHKLLIWLVLGPLLIGFVVCIVGSWWMAAPLWIQILSVLLMPVFVAALLRAIFPKAKWLQKLQEVLFQMLISIVAFPIRLVWRTVRFVFQNERRTVRLNPYYPVIGRRPPILNQRETTETQKSPTG